MPKVRQFTSYDPLEADIRAEIAAGLARMQITQRELARRSGIDHTKLSRRLRNVGDMRLSELWAIRKVFRKGGIE